MVKKFYMETKDSTLESAILDVWENAADLEEMSAADKARKFKAMGRTKKNVTLTKIGTRTHATSDGGNVGGAQRTAKKKPGKSSATQDHLAGYTDATREKQSGETLRKRKEKLKAKFSKEEIENFEQLWAEAAEETEHGSGENAFEMGTDRYANYTNSITPGQQVEESFENINEASDWLFEQIEGMTDEEFDDLLEEADELELEGILGAIGRGIAKVATAGSTSSRLARAKKKGEKIGMKLDLKKQKVANVAKKKELKQVRKDNPGAIRKAAGAIKARIKKSAEEVELGEGVKLNGQEQLKGLRETVLDMWKEAADTHVDPKDREELDKEPDGRGGAETAKKMKRADEPKPMVATEAVEKNDKDLTDEELSAKQKKIDLNKNGKVDGDDLSKLRKKGAKKEDAELDEGGMKRGKDLKTFKPKPKEKKEEVDEELTIPQAQEFKVSSMRHALAKVWGLEEGELPPALKKAIDAKKKDGDEDEDKEESVKKGGKTETGKKMAEIEIDPELKEKNKK